MASHCRAAAAAADDPPERQDPGHDRQEPEELPTHQEVTYRAGRRPWASSVASRSTRIGGGYPFDHWQPPATTGSRDVPFLSPLWNCGASVVRKTLYFGGAWGFRGNDDESAETARARRARATVL